MPEEMQPAVQPDAYCERCKKPLRWEPSSNPKSRPFRKASKPKGLCPDCVMTEFLYNTFPVNMIFDRNPELLRQGELMRMALTSSGVMENCEMDVDEVDWDRVAENWALPVKVKPSPQNPYRMGEGGS